jgi:hypothetical protein
MLVWMAVGKLCRARVDRGGEQTLARGGTVSAEKSDREAHPILEAVR